MQSTHTVALILSFVGLFLFVIVANVGARMWSKKREFDLEAESQANRQRGQPLRPNSEFIQPVPLEVFSESVVLDIHHPDIPVITITPEQMAQSDNPGTTPKVHPPGSAAPSDDGLSVNTSDIGKAV